MAVRRSVILSLAALLVLALLVPAIVAAGGQSQGERGAGGFSAGSGHGEAGTGNHAAAAGGSLAAPRSDTGAPAIQADNGARAGVRAAPAPHQSAAPAVVGARSAFAGGRAYRGGTALRESSAGSGAPASGPGVTRTAGRDYPVQSGTGTPRVARPTDGGAERSGDPGQGTHHRGPPADPVPFAAPTRPADEQKGPAPGTGEPSAARGRKDGAHPPTFTSDGTGVPDPRLLLQFLLVLGFRRVRPGNVLEHPLRRTLHAAIGAEPGLDLAGCAAATGANRETIRYHLALLVCCGKVVEESRSGSVRYFPHDPCLTPVRRALHHALRNESLAPMLAAIRDAPGLSRQELAERLRVSGPSATRQVQRLIEDGLVERERRGRWTCYRLTPGCTDAFGPSLAVVPDVPAPGRVAA